MAELPRLTAAQAAARLGVKPESLYAYVSRGLLTRERTAAGSTFDPLEVEAFARSRRRRATVSPATNATTSPGAPLMVLDTDIALVEDDDLYFRGRLAGVLADDRLAEVAAWLWQVDAAALRAPDSAELAAARLLVTALPTGATILDCITVAVTALAATDPLRDHRAAEHLARVGGRLLAGVPAALGEQNDLNDLSEPFDVAGRLWRGLSTRAPDPGEVRVLESALILMIDHDLAVSTLAARVAASARGSGYAVVHAALGALDTPLHGSASRGAARLLRHVVRGASPAAALAGAIVDGDHGIPGFGQPLYAGSDARARLLLDRLRTVDAAASVREAVDAIGTEVLRRADLHPNVDLALAALTIAFDMDDDAGSAVFAIGRMIGWIAHALAEYDERPMRLRPRGRYVGPEPA